MSSSAPALLNDLYQFTMAEAYLSAGLSARRAVFELFLRKAPHGGVVALAAGTAAVLEFVEGFRFTAEDIRYLRSLGLLGEDLLRRLTGLRFSGDVDMVAEGTAVFPGEPLVRVSAPILEAQLLETPLLNLIGFATLVATKAARVKLAAGPAEVVEYGCRRAQGPDGALTASRAAFIGGAGSTSNLEAGRRFGIPVRGTMAHSFVMAFESEAEAFRAYARAFPGRAVLLLDTYSTLESGLPSALAVARELRGRGESLAAVRIDSGDLGAIARETRTRLDAAGFPEVKIIASGDLDEARIEALRAAGAPIDAYGVGGRLSVSEGDPALNCVYKLAAIEGATGSGGLKPRMKRTDDPGKATLPGAKQVYRRREAGDLARGDVLALDSPDDRPESWGTGSPVTWTPFLAPAFRGGRRLLPAESLGDVQARARAELESLPPEHRRLARPAPYPVELSPGLQQLRRSLTREG